MIEFDKKISVATKVNDQMCDQGPRNLVFTSDQNF